MVSPPAEKDGRGNEEGVKGFRWTKNTVFLSPVIVLDRKENNKEGPEKGN